MSSDNSSSTRSEESWAAGTGYPTLVSQTPQRPGITHLLLFTGLFVPLVFLPYIPIRRHLLQQTRQVETLRSQLMNQLSVTRENSRKLASMIHENQQLGKQVAGLRGEMTRIELAIEELKEGEREKIAGKEVQREWNEKILGAIEKMQKDTKVLTPETFSQLSESLVHLAAFVELEERKNGFHRSGDEDSRGVGVMRTLAMRLLEVSGVEYATAEEIIKAQQMHTPPPPQPEPQPRPTIERKVRQEIPIRTEDRSDPTWMW